MATLKQKIAAESTLRELLEQNGLPEPDRVEYGYTCIRLFWNEPKAVVIVDIDELPEGDAVANVRANSWSERGPAA